MSFEEQINQKQNIIIVWLRNDLRLHDHEALFKACQYAEFVLPIYCVDPRHFEETSFGFPKTGAFRAKYLLESLQDLKLNLQDKGGDLIIKHGKPEEVIFAIARQYQVKAIYCHQEATDEEMEVEEALSRNLMTEKIPMHYFWGSTLYHYDDLPFQIDDLPDVFTSFRKKMERKATPRATFPVPDKVNLHPDFIGKGGKVPTLEELDLASPELDERTAFVQKGGETAALLRMKHYFWDTDNIEVYKETRNGLIGVDYSTKFSAALAHGCISPRLIYEEVKRYETERVENRSTYWVIFELLWRDYFRFLAMRYGNDIFKRAGIKAEEIVGKNDKVRFQKWVDGETGYPFVDANMRELKATGFMSNRGRQNVASFLVKDLNVNWQMGAAYFESLLVDYDPCSNYGNWNYVAGIGNDPREDRYFNVITQAKRYDAEGEYVKLWCKELKKLPSSRVHEPFTLDRAQQKYLGLTIGVDYPNPVVKLRKIKYKSNKK